MDYFLKTVPFEHQQECLDLSVDRQVFAILMEQGLGKTKVAIDTAVSLYLARKIDGLFVVAPNGVYLNWTRREIPAHMPDGINQMILAWDGGTTKRFTAAFKCLTEFDGLAIFCMNVEALSSGTRALGIAQRFLMRRRSLMIVDESTRIKTPKSTRTRNVWHLGRLAPYRRIMTGTPVTQSPFDLYAQFRFLSPSILGFHTFAEFKARYGVWQKGYVYRSGARTEFPDLISYARLDELARKIASHSYRRTKAECLDLPAKIYVRIPVEMSSQQRQLINEIEAEGAVTFDGFEFLTPLQITRLLRVQQVTGGFLPTWEPMQDVPRPLAENPKLKTLIDLTNDVYVGKTLIWARFRHEIDIIRRALINDRHDNLVELHGGITGTVRADNVDRFQNDPTVRYMVGQQASGIGITLTAAEYVFYYSNTFSYEERYQSEDRVHRIGQTRSVVYVDLEGIDTVDERIRDVLNRARGIADSIMENLQRRGNGF